MSLSKNQMGDLIKKARKLQSTQLGKRYTQVMLANDIGMSQGYIGDIESGRTYPTIKVLNKIAEACGVPLSFFSYKIDTDKIIDPVSGSDSFLNIEHMLPLPNVNNEEKNNYIDIFKNYILMTKQIHDSLPDISYVDPKTNKTINIEVKSTKPLEKLGHTSPDSTLVNYMDKENESNSNNIDLLTTTDDISNKNKTIEINDIIYKLLSTPNLTLNGYPISKDVKVTLQNSIKLGIEFATQLQNKELELSKLNKHKSTLPPE